MCLCMCAYVCVCVCVCVYVRLCFCLYVCALCVLCVCVRARACNIASNIVMNASQERRYFSGVQGQKGQVKTRDTHKYTHTKI